jgi:hypothetical protein
MKFPTRILRRVCLISCLFLSACEKPQQRTAGQPGDEAGPEAAPAAPPPVVEATPPAEEAPAAAAPTVPAPPERPASGRDPDPELSVAMVDEKISVSGALRSRIQVERIVETLRREFPEHEIESTLVVDNGRMGVGWGNRVADEFLVMFFQKVSPARVTYRDTVLTLDGTLKSARDLQMVSETAIQVFSGSTTETVKNNLKTSGSSKP